MKFSVLMSVYHKERPDFLNQSIASILNQTTPPDEIVLVEDGPLTDELYDIISGYQKKYDGLFRVVKLKENRGLGNALAIGIKHCNHHLIARMDTDDVAREDRFAVQLKEFEKSPDLDIVGSHIIEFEHSIQKTLSKRLLPIEHKDIYQFAKRRNPFNHMTVMFKKESVLQAGNYKDYCGFEDYYLWARMLKNGCQGRNIDDFLVYARADDNMMKRRGGISYLLSMLKVKREIYRLGMSSLQDYLVSIAPHVVISLLPESARLYTYRKFLRG